MLGKRDFGSPATGVVTWLGRWERIDRNTSLLPRPIDSFAYRASNDGPSSGASEVGLHLRIGRCSCRIREERQRGQPP
jgi:hypothetical protein